MRSDVARDLSWSAAAFSRVVWPVVAGGCGGGELRPTESINDDGGLIQDLDTLAGIDAFQVMRADGMVRGIASRVQPTKPFETFTIRFSRHTNADTEWIKRHRAINGGGIVPHLTVHAYVDGSITPRVDATLVKSVAVMQTKQLYDFARAQFEAWARTLGHEPSTSKSDAAAGARFGVGLRDVYDGNVLLWVSWAAIRDAELRIKVWSQSSNEVRGAA